MARERNDEVRDIEPHYIDANDFVSLGGAIVILWLVMIAGDRVGLPLWATALFPAVPYCLYLRAYLRWCQRRTAQRAAHQ